MSNPVADLQAELTREWARAEKFLDTGKPLTQKFWDNMAEFWESMERFDATENSLRRAGFSGCISGNCEDSVVSCRACLAEPQTLSLL